MLIVFPVIHFQSVLDLDLPDPSKEVCQEVSDDSTFAL